ncbi:thiamine pyrophosphate-binding protein [sulfur-oxidizing endosymbiont of Gigantopelta aegis]|uniref:thiamine pyrophosphate-binding protein n=1 Tax=sulfur-oxidizing endosymbiont of Gigantopelta aegis TaxID=2794934 RepID=UPI0018DE88F8|nr:thiamine pyrophosphate-binding protein [sulfur-oxidizing endosymbiont of Gigantopelta aegis]
MKIAVSELIVRFMENLGIDHIFGMPGAHILPVYDSLYHSSIQTVLAKHEQGASFMAGGYARATGKISACITTAGPGATNLVTGVANAYVDQQPMLIITGETSTHIFGKGGLQESSGEGGSIDQCALFSSITQYTKLVERTDYFANVLNRVAKILLSDNSGPVLLSFPFNIQKEMVDESILEQISTSRNKRYHQQHDILAANELLTMIQAASAPVIVAGNGCILSGAQQAVADLSEQLGIPVTSSLKGKGVVSEHSDLSLGSLGVTSYSGAYHYILEQADLIIFLGAGFNERTSYVWNEDLLKNKKIAQIDNNSEQLEKVFKADLAILGDINVIIKTVNVSLRSLINADEQEKQRQTIAATVHAYRTKENGQSGSEIAQLGSRFPLVELFFAELEQQFPEKLMVFDDNIIFAQNFFHVSSDNRYFPNSGVSSLGHAIPAAIGAGFASKKQGDNYHVFAVLGDGGFQMCCMEIMTAVNYQIPMTIVMFNNSTMGLIRKNQFQQYEERYIDCDFVNPDYELLSRSFGINYHTVSNADEMQGLLAKFDYKESINLIEIMIDKDVFPGYVSRR